MCSPAHRRRGEIARRAKHRAVAASQRHTGGWVAAEEAVGDAKDEDDGAGDDSAQDGDGGLAAQGQVVAGLCVGAAVGIVGIEDDEEDDLRDEPVQRAGDEERENAVAVVEFAVLTKGKSCICLRSSGV